MPLKTGIRIPEGYPELPGSAKEIRVQCWRQPAVCPAEQPLKDSAFRVKQDSPTYLPVASFNCSFQPRKNTAGRLRKHLPRNLPLSNYSR